MNYEAKELQWLYAFRPDGYGKSYNRKPELGYMILDEETLDYYFYSIDVQGKLSKNKKMKIHFQDVGNAVYFAYSKEEAIYGCNRLIDQWQDYYREEIIELQEVINSMEEMKITNNNELKFAKEEDNLLYKSAVAKWGQDLVDDCLHDWSLKEVEQGYIYASVDLVDYMQVPYALQNKSIVVIDQIAELEGGETLYDYETAVSLAKKNGEKIDEDLLKSLQTLDSANYKLYVPIVCEENTKLLEELKPYVKEYKAKRAKGMLCDNCDFDFENDGFSINVTMETEEETIDESVPETLFVDEIDNIENIVSDFVEAYAEENEVEVSSYEWEAYCPECMETIDLGRFEQHVDLDVVVKDANVRNQEQYANDISKLEMAEKEF